MDNPKNYDIQGDAIAKRSVRTSEKDQDKKIIKDSGKSMRFFLNLSFALIIAFPVFILLGWQWLTTLALIAYLIPVITTIIFFIAFYRLLKRIEKCANKERDLELVSKVIWEFNKSNLIRLAMGKTQPFIDEE